MSKATAEEDALYAEILKHPTNYRLRLQWSVLAAKRQDPRAKVVQIQISPVDDNDAEVANKLIRSHPEWTAPLAALGARDIKIIEGFPGEITIDASAFLSNGAKIVATAPIVRLHVRAAKGHVREIVQSPLLATIASLDLDDQGVTDDDLVALASSPHVTGLEQLDLRYNPIYARGIEALAASPRLKQLKVVNLDGNPDDPVDRLEYYDETNTHRVPTDAGKALEAKYGPLRWLHPG